MVALLLLLSALFGISSAVSFRLNDTNSIAPCLLLDGHLAVTINGSSFELNSTLVSNVSDCSIASTTALLAITWNTGMEMNFTFKGNASGWGLTQISYSDGNVTAFANSNSSLFSTTSNNKSYECDANQSISFAPSSSAVDLNVTNWRAQAFFFTSIDGSFDGATHCVLDPTPLPSTSSSYSPTYFPTPTATPSPGTTDNKVVPIAVGAALAGLVIIVLVVYLIGRFKSRRETAYQVLP